MQHCMPHIDGSLTTEGPTAGKHLVQQHTAGKNIGAGVYSIATRLFLSRKTVEHHNDDAFVAEASLKHRGWTFFGRGEITENRERLVLARVFGI